jgi:hypothetical protein
MRLIDADELMEHVWRDKLDSRELIAKMIDDAPTVKEISTKIPINVFEQLISQESKTRHWIPVSERLPEAFSFVNCTCHSLIDDREDWVVETLYIPQPLHSPYSDWGNIPMLNHCECEVIAWMYRDIPKPYKAESEEV